MFESMGSYLRRERELRKITLEELSAQTRIRPEYLHAIEAERFEKLPGLTFVKGYLRAYANGIGLIPEEVVLRFEGYLARLSGESRSLKPDRKISIQWKWLLLPFTLLLLLGYLWLR